MITTSYFQVTPPTQSPKGWDFILNWMSDRVMQKSKEGAKKHAEHDTSNDTLASGEKQIDDEAYPISDTNHVDNNSEIISKVSVNYFDEKHDYIKELDVKHLENMLVPLPGQGQKLQEKKCTDI